MTRRPALGMVDVNVLTVDGQPAAFLYGYHYRGNVIGLRTGFDAALRDGIGSALMLKTIDDSCRRGDRIIDFGPGEREHKRRLRTRTGIDLPPHVHADRFVAFASGAADPLGEKQIAAAGARGDGELRWNVRLLITAPTMSRFDK